MKKIILTFFIGLSANVFAQEELLIRDDFDDKTTGWWVGESETVEATVKKDLYIIKHKKGDGYGWMLYKNFGLDLSSDYYIETKIKKSSGPEDMGYGLYLMDEGDFDSHESFYFTITPNGYYKITNYHEGRKDNPIKDWTTTKINKKDDNIIAVRKVGRTVTFYINGQEVYKNNRKFFGNNVGFVVYDKSTVEVDYLLVKQTKKSINLIPDANRGYKKESLGAAINSPYYEKTAVISADAKTLYIGRDGDPANTVNKDNTDIWYSEKQQDGTWAKMKNIGRPLNNESHNFVISVSPDGNSLMVGNIYNSDGTAGGGGVSLSTKTLNGWTLPTKVEIDGYSNLSKYVGNSLSVDRKTYIMALEKEEGYGDMDFYVSFMNDQGKFSKPLNLGPVINSPGHDFGPFLAPDNKTLYFSSLGHKGYGSSDIFVSKRLDDTWTNWSEPQNLGTDVNSSSFDAYYSVSALGDYAYVSSAENAIGGTDIFKIKLPEAARPDPVVLVYGKVLNSKTSQPLQADIKYFDMSANKEIGLASSNSVDGAYKIILPYGKVYSFLADKKGFYSVSENIDVSNIKEYQEIERNLYLSPIEQGESIRLNNLFFEYNKAELKSESFAELGRLIKILNDNTSMIIEIGGHTDGQGSDEYNQKLSESRAKSVVAYLTSKNISAQRLSAKGYGKSKPVASNETEEGRAQNRRVEFTIIKK